MNKVHGFAGKIPACPQQNLTQVLSLIDTLTPGYLSSQIYIFQTKFLHDVFLKETVPDTDSFCFLGMDLRKKAII